MRAAWVFLGSRLAPAQLAETVGDSKRREDVISLCYIVQQRLYSNILYGFQWHSEAASNSPKVQREVVAHFKLHSLSLDRISTVRRWGRTCAREDGILRLAYFLTQSGSSEGIFRRQKKKQVIFHKTKTQTHSHLPFICCTTWRQHQKGKFRVDSYRTFKFIFIKFHQPLFIILISGVFVFAFELQTLPSTSNSFSEHKLITVGDNFRQNFQEKFKFIQYTLGKYFDHQNKLSIEIISENALIKFKQFRQTQQRTIRVFSWKLYFCQHCTKPKHLLWLDDDELPHHHHQSRG